MNQGPQLSQGAITERQRTDSAEVSSDRCAPLAAPFATPNDAPSERFVADDRAALPTLYSLMLALLLIARSEQWSDHTFVAGALLLIVVVGQFTFRRASMIDRLTERAEDASGRAPAVHAAQQVDAQLEAASTRALGDDAIRGLPPPYLS